MAVLIEDLVPGIRENGLNTKKAIDFSNAPSLLLPPVSLTVDGFVSAAGAILYDWSASSGNMKSTTGQFLMYADLFMQSSKMLTVDRSDVGASSGAATSNAQAGTVTSESLTTAAGSAYTLTLTNNKIASFSKVFVSVDNGSNTQGTLSIGTVTVSSGQAVIKINNIHASQALNGTIKITFIAF